MIIQATPLKIFCAIVLLSAGPVDFCASAEKAWNFDSLKEMVKRPWGSKGSLGIIEGGTRLKIRKEGILSYVHHARHCYFSLQFDGVILDAKKYNILKIRLHASVPGKLILFYMAPKKVIATMDEPIEVIAGWTEYEIEMSEQTFGRAYHSDASKDTRYQQWGGESQKISGLRIDPWFAKDSKVQFDYIRLVTP